MTLTVLFAATHTQTSDEISKIIKETMDDVNGTVYSIMSTLNRLVSEKNKNGI